MHAFYWPHCMQVNNFGFWHVPTLDKGVRHIMTHAMVERFREAAGDPAWVQVWKRACMHACAHACKHIHARACMHTST